ncbi:MAG TPA: ATP-binding protein [Candidatus Polarisedimenticolia bacterium]|jgi:signal transduction histidine kinase
MACLVFSDNSGRQIVYSIDRDRVSIGRSNDNDIVSLDLRVSRHHASITRSSDDGACSIRDEGSSLGVFVNQKRVTDSPLRDGDTIRIGDSIYSFVDIPASPLDSYSGLGGQAPSDAGLRGGALVAELQEAIGSLRHTIHDAHSDRRILDQCLSLVDARLESLRHHLIRIERGRLMMQTLYEVGKIINSSYDRANLLELVLELAVNVVRAERGFLTLYEPGSGAFTRRAAINMGEAAPATRDVADAVTTLTDAPAESARAPLPAGGRGFSTGIALTVARTGKPVVTTDAQADERFMQMNSVVDLNIRSALCVPLVDRSGAVMGVLYVDTRASIVMFTSEDQDFLMAFANYASIAIENAALFAEAGARARVEEELRQARKLDEMKSDMISIVSHDVRTPLTSIKSYAEILHDDFDSLGSDQVRHFLDIINREADRLSRLVTTYLDLQKIEAGMMRLTLAPIEVRELIEESLQTFVGTALDKEIALSKRVDPGLPALQGDRDRLLQVLANLLSNALKFTPKGGAVTVGASTSTLPGSGRALEITVRDTGEGIPPDKLDHLFRRFVQMGEGRTEQKRGTGLGLVFSREIVELHGGRVGVASTPGEGTTFQVVLPVDGP